MKRVRTAFKPVQILTRDLVNRCHNICAGEESVNRIKHRHNRVKTNFSEPQFSSYASSSPDFSTSPRLRVSKRRDPEFFLFLFIQASLIETILSNKKSHKILSLLVQDSSTFFEHHDPSSRTCETSIIFSRIGGRASWSEIGRRSISRAANLGKGRRGTHST